MVINKYGHALLVRLVFISSLMNIKEVDKQIQKLISTPYGFLQILTKLPQRIETERLNIHTAGAHDLIWDNKAEFFLT